MNYEAKIIEKFESDLRIGIFQDGRQIGEYVRNYQSLFKTFSPFTLDSQDYALYSPYYTGTRIMELPSCKDIGGDKKDVDGFCPVEYYIPQIRKTVSKYKDEYFIKYEFDNEKGYDEPDPDVIHQEKIFLPFGFVAGCHWGDDSSWKIQHIDLSKISSGILERTDLIGYREMIPFFDLKKSIKFLDFHSSFSKSIDLALASSPPEEFRFILYIQDPTFYDWNVKELKGQRHEH